MFNDVSCFDYDQYCYMRKVIMRRLRKMESQMLEVTEEQEEIHGCANTWIGMEQNTQRQKATDRDRYKDSQ